MEELSELLRIPSISADPERKDDVRRAAEWVAESVRRMGGKAELVETETFPLVVGEVRASGGGDAPTVLCYGHFGVQPAGAADEWETDPARGATVRVTCTPLAPADTRSQETLPSASTRATAVGC